jgi:ribonucleoside-diphosphate reductase alpha chain
MGHGEWAVLQKSEKSSANGRGQRENGGMKRQPGAVDDAGAAGAQKGHGDEPRESGLSVRRLFTRPGLDPFEGVAWERRSARIANEAGKAIFQQDEVEVPASWSQIATNVVVSKYFRGNPGSPERESSVKQLIGRVVRTIADWGRGVGAFATTEDAEAYEAELAHLVLHQMGTFNSPVWFNVGLTERPQCSACFINSVEDTMESILDLARIEARLFKGGSGTGTNLSALRSSRERLSGGGLASGPVSFMKGFDSFAGVIRSGGKTRRAAKMVILDVDHPDILEFIRCKAGEERKAWALIDAGYDGSMDGEAYASVFYQNSNNSVRVTDSFMEAAEARAPWTTYARTTAEPLLTYQADELLREIAQATHQCGDPGLQFDTATNDWHTCPNAGRINGSNPCSEFVFLDNTACNLASLNLLAFVGDDGELDADALRHAVDIFVTAQEIIVDQARYPTDEIAHNSRRFRPLGLGYANLGALLMARGLPYDSDAGRAYAGAVTALMTGEAYAQSARIAEQVGPFAEFERNRQPMLRVIDKHRRALEGLDASLLPEPLHRAAVAVWDEARARGEAAGFRNAQVTVLAPTGTIAFMMDCDTTGVEPDIALVKFKNLVGGGVIKIVNRTVPMALARLGYGARDADEIVAHIEERGSAEGAPRLRREHLPIFDCALRTEEGTRYISPEGHLRMMAAVQPFISGAISKTVNVPEEATVEEIEAVYVDAWRLGLKAISVYREGSKRTQPLTTKRSENAAAAQAETRPRRRRLPDERISVTHKFSIAGHEGYITVGMYDDGSPGEIFIRMAKAGSVVSGLMDSFALAISLSLQYGVPLQVLVDKYSHSRFEPSGFTTNPQIPIAKSIMDYIFRWLGMKFLRDDEQPPADAGAADDVASPHLPLTASEVPLPAGTIEEQRRAEQRIYVQQADAPVCLECGGWMTRSGTCYRCMNCGSTSGCS